MAYSTVKTPHTKKENRKSFRRRIGTNLTLGIVRGIGMAIGFSGLAVVLLAVTKIIPLDKIPLLGDIINALISGKQP